MSPFPRPATNAFFALFAFLTLLGAVLYAAKQVAAPWIYLVGGIGLLCVKAHSFRKGQYPTETLRRLHLQRLFAGVALVLSAIFMQTTRGNEWIAVLCIAAVLELYTSFRIPAEERKQQKR